MKCNLEKNELRRVIHIAPSIKRISLGGVRCFEDAPRNTLFREEQQRCQARGRWLDVARVIVVV